MATTDINSSFDSPSLFIDFSRLPPPNVIERLDYEQLLKVRQSKVVELMPALARAVKMEQSPTNVILEADAAGELAVRARINAAARATMLAFAIGADLDNLAAFFSQGRAFDVVRLPLVDSPRDIASFPDDWESDAAFRRRIQLAPEAYASAGSEGGYIFHALSAAPTLQDVSAIRVNDRGLVRITLMNSGLDPVPTQAQMDAVTARLNDTGIKPLTDTVYVAKVMPIPAAISGTITLYDGPDASLVVADIKAAITRIRARTGLLGRDLNRSALIAALSQEGVQNVSLDTPVSDIVCDATQCVLIAQESRLNVATARAN